MTDLIRIWTPRRIPREHLLRLLPMLPGKRHLPTVPGHVQAIRNGRAPLRPDQVSRSPATGPIHHFSCKTDDYKHFLTCATQNNTRNHVHCCKTQLVPSFCYDFCSGDFQVVCLLPVVYPPVQMLRRSHRLCLYYLPEIFECFERGYRMLNHPHVEQLNSLSSIPVSAFSLHGH